MTYLSAWLAALRRKLAMVRHGRTPRPRDRHDTFPRAFTAAEAVEAEKILDHHAKGAISSAEFVEGLMAGLNDGVRRLPQSPPSALEVAQAREVARERGWLIGDEWIWERQP